MAMFVATLIMFCAYVLYSQGRNFLEKPRASYNVQEDIMQLARFVSRDLEETNLLTVQSFPNAANPDEPPGLSLQSPRSFDGDLLVMSEYGNVRWQKYVYYTLVPVSERVGNLVRKEGTLDEDQPNPLDPDRRVPMASGKKPTEGGGPSNLRIVARNVLLPNLRTPYATTDPFGGFKVTSLVGEGMGPLLGVGGREEPIRVDLGVLEVSPSTQKTSVLTMTLKVMPRN